MVTGVKCNWWIQGNLLLLFSVIHGMFEIFHFVPWKHKRNHISWWLSPKYILLKCTFLLCWPEHVSIFPYACMVKNTYVVLFLWCHFLKFWVKVLEKNFVILQFYVWGLHNSNFRTCRIEVGGNTSRH